MSRENPPEQLDAPSPRRGDSPRNWAEPGLGVNWQYRFAFWIMHLGGKARGYHIANIAAAWYVLFYPSIRRRCRFYLQRRFPDHLGWWRGLMDTFRLIQNYATTLADMKVLEMFGPRELSAHCPEHDRLIQLCSSERGFVVLQAHAGCWQIGMSTLGQFSKHVSIVMIPEAKTLALLGAQAATAIDPRSGLDGVMQMTDALLRGEIVTMMGDRTFGTEQTAATVQFLGSPALFPITPYRLASATGVPVLVMLAPKTRANAYELRLAKIIDVPQNLGRDPRNYVQYAQQFADCLEQFARDFPWQVYNFYDLWLDSPKHS